MSDLELLDAIVRLLPTGVTVQDSDGNFLLVNDAAASQLNTPARMLGCTPGAISLIPPQGHAEGCKTSIIAERRVGHDSDQVFLANERDVNIADRALRLSTFVDVTAQSTAEQELTRRAYFDQLTDLPNRSLIEEHIVALIADPGCATFGLAFLDIDHFKAINDYYGHAIGDALLKKAAKRLQDQLAPTDTLARLSGDEFLIVIDPVKDANELAAKISQLLKRFKEPFYVDGFEIFASASVGVSLYPDHGCDLDTLRHKADIAMYRVKSEIKGVSAIFDAQMEQELSARTELEQRLRLAILDRRFRCAFQPKVDIRTNEILGVEALVRLRDENGILQAPGSFINLAVELGLIDELTHLVLAEIVQSLDLIDDTFGEGVRVCINVAAKQAGNVAFMQSFTSELEATGCAERFMIEVTEDAFISKSNFQTEILPMLATLGVGVSIDDFGTGYSSLSALADITADEIKIDRSFITDIHKRPRSQGILKAIESLGDALGMSVIAEGVESHEELAYLQAATTIRYAQGYYFAKPLCVEEFSPGHRLVKTSRESAIARPGGEVRTLRSRVSAGRR